MPEIEIAVLKGNGMKLDGGSMFGNAPKALWGGWMPADDRNMIDIASQCLLVKTPESRVLFETGAGAYLSPEMKQRFQIRDEGHMLLASLENHGLGHEDITHVVLSHLHFDHAGGLLAEWEEGREHPELLFPNARFIIGRENFKRSAEPHFRDRASFIPGLAGLLERSGRLDLVRDGDRLDLDGANIEFTESNGHTPGMLVSWIRAKDATLVFTGDLIPASPWVNLPITMGYDRFPEGLIDEKKQLLEKALEAGALMIYPHDPVCAASYLELDGRTSRIKPGKKMAELTMVV
ncbi:MAG: MBL fold metallo-hydrolase [Desulfobacterales bacterium]|nr:MBL fold metallo-hydrolase [Desulfobacterales bacterium]